MITGNSGNKRARSARRQLALRTFSRAWTFRAAAIWVGSICITFGMLGWCAAPFAFGGNVDAHWLSPVFGQWSDPTAWSSNPYFPNNGTPAGTTYTAFVDATGASYQVILGTTATVSGLTINSDGARVTDQGNLTVNGQLSALAGQFALSDGGTLANASITTSGTGLVYAFGGTLSGVTIGPNSSGGSSVVLTSRSNPTASGLNFANGSLSLQGVDALTTLTLTSATPLSGTGRIIFDGGGTVTPSNTALAIPSGITFQTGVSSADYAHVIRVTVGDTSHVSDLANQGTISAQTPGLLMTVTGNNVTNQGTIQAISNGWLTIAGNFVNSGTLIENNATLNFANSNFTPTILPAIQRTGGAVNLAAMYNNTAKTLTLDNTTGSLGLVDGGKIVGGTISASGGAKLLVAQSMINASPSGTLDSVTLASDLVVQEQGTLSVPNGLTIQNSTITLGTSLKPVPFAGGEGTLITFNGVLGGTGQVVFEQTAFGDRLMPGTGDSLTIAPGITVRTDTAGGTIGQLVYFNTFQPPFSTPVVNQGTIISQTAGQVLTVTGSSVTNAGTMQAVGGGKLKLENLINTGQVISRGAPLQLLAAINNQGTISIDSGATLSPDSPAANSFTQTSSGVLDFVLAQPISPTSPLFSITGNGTAALDGELSIHLSAGFNPALGTQWTLLSAKSVSGTFNSTSFPNLSPGRSFEVDYHPTSVTLTVVPEPCSASLCALAGIALLRRRAPRRMSH